MPRKTVGALLLVVLGGGCGTESAAPRARPVGKFQGVVDPAARRVEIALVDSGSGPPGSAGVWQTVPEENLLLSSPGFTPMACPGGGNCLWAGVTVFNDTGVTLNDLFAELTSVEPPEHVFCYDPFCRDALPFGAPMDDTLGLRGYGTLANGVSRGNTWMFVYTTAERFFFRGQLWADR